jgi:hypothetical protein
MLNEQPRRELRRLHSNGKCLGEDVAIATGIRSDMYAQAYALEVWMHALIIVLDP